MWSPGADAQERAGYLRREHRRRVWAGRRPRVSEDIEAIEMNEG